MSKIKRVKYFTNEKKAMINPENRRAYDKYLQSQIIKNRDVKETTYKVYRNYMDHFMVYLMEDWENIHLYSEEFIDNAVDIMEGYIGFCQDKLYNNKKVINTKLSTVSSFFVWSLKRKLVDKHPFDKQLDRMKGANDEKIIASHYLDEEQTTFITEELKTDKKYDIQDRLIWGIMYDSANRVGAISKLTLSSLDLDNMVFEDIREKRGKMVEVVFEEDTKQLLEEWLELRKDMDNLEVDALFITKMNGEYRPMTKGTIQSRVKKIGHILGIDDFRSHSIRKTTLNQIYESTGDLSLASEYANHNSLDTTKQSYIRPQSKTEMREKLAELRKQKQDQKDKNKNANE
ncbi:site-specific integrase [Bacillus sp. FJAT-22090]|uniref:tyrosine-type recombinase/integrase n=1 Tax=Bacillus sp. FJAT-22090 TaxID=1581038 RepID=UPI0021B167F9|nr:site-specific integrase [Bacillus sp. FJAT-22090]